MPAWRTIALVTATALLATPAAAVADRVWHPTLTIVPPGPEPGDPSAADGGGGRSLVAYPTRAGRRFQLEARLRNGPVARWTRVVLSGTYPAVVETPAAALDGTGRGFVAWRVPGGPVRAAVRDVPNGPWRVVPVAPGGTAGTGFGDAVARIRNGDGRGTVVWAEGATAVRAASRPGLGAAWTETPPLTLDPGASRPSIALSTDGTAVAAWTVPQDAGFFATGPLRAAVRSADGTWSAPVTLAPGGALAASAGAGDAGRAVVAWEDRSGGASRVLVAEKPFEQAWGAPVDVAAGAVPRVAANVAGDLVLTWAGTGTPEATPILAVVRPAGTPWPAPTLLTPGRDQSWVEASLARLAIGGGARAFVAWLDPQGPGSAEVNLAAAKAGEPWTRSARQVATDETGFSLSASFSNALAVSPVETTEGYRLDAYDFDGFARPVVTARLGGVRRADDTTGWTAVMRNPSRVAAVDARLNLTLCCGVRLVSASPRGVQSGTSVAWTVPRVAPGGTSVVRLVTRPDTRLQGFTRAVAAAPVAVVTTVRG